MEVRHIQDPSTASSFELHWGYPSRVVPCTNDRGSCEYLDVVYHSHDLGLIYTGIFWLTIAAILLLWGLTRLFPPSPASSAVKYDLCVEESHGASRQPSLVRLRSSIAAWTRRYLLPECLVSLFGHTTRLQVVILATLVAYLTVWTFVGIVYKTWITPVKNLPNVHNTRTSLGPWADRVGVLAYALTPLSILLSSRESILSLITGVPYQSFLFLHRWTGYIILTQSVLHTIGWTIVEARLYQPQPKVWNEFVSQLYIIWGWVGLGLLLLLWLLTLPWAIRTLGYEFFRKAHYVLAMVYIGAVIGHWQALQCYLIPGLALWFIDRTVRLVRTAMLHYQYLPKKRRMGFAAADAAVTIYEDKESGDVIRLDFSQYQRPWRIGQHYYLCFAESSIWQSHPFTPLNDPTVTHGTVSHSYIFRAKTGETRKIADLVLAKALGGGTSVEQQPAPVTTPVILSGAYGQGISEDLSPTDNVLCVAGGTGITFVLPVLLRLAKQAPRSNTKIELIWAVRRESDIGWIGAELGKLRDTLGQQRGVKLHVFVTREPVVEKMVSGKFNSRASTDVKSTPVDISASSNASAPSSDGADEPRLSISHPVTTQTPQSRRPDLREEVDRFVSSVESGPTVVFASGPMSMIQHLRGAVAAKNNGGRVWKGETQCDVRLVCDDRIEW
ncbi:uncharacterized protein E0L32_009037 [Thyridium curvatum]|uniref:FAD-binding FR-type domain-containing protein n=1 Tax=Thyridium curvatum TaxID=1093900 RepID=A0A507AY16_9PEZI|nr:uncharacterized protein E0L32_009037 [Thyridium curvatum]TPX09698.1 hypothetical protein E0L32_009037 [Thyridium curvatum]